MTPYQKLLNGSSVKRPLLTETLPPSAFCDRWQKRPSEPVKIGLRCGLSEDELSNAQRMAMNTAWDEYPRPEDLELRLESYNDHLVTNVLARACTSADDTSTTFFAPAPEELIRVALAPGGIRQLWNAWERFSIGLSPIGEELDLEELQALAKLLTERADKANVRARRFAAILRKELEQDG